MTCGFPGTSGRRKEVDSLQLVQAETPEKNSEKWLRLCLKNGGKASTLPDTSSDEND